MKQIADMLTDNLLINSLFSNFIRKGFLLLKTVFFLSFTSTLIAQNFSLPEKISALQVSSDTFYNEGLFKSQLVWKKGKKIAEDNNIFFTALTLYTLQSIADSLPEESQQTIMSIYDKAAPNFQYYKNRNGGITYNFYQVRPMDKPFPGLKRISNWEVAKLPDDMDDTSILYLIQHSDDSLYLTLKRLMTIQSHKQEKIKSTPKAYQLTEAYPTWFADKMKQDLDVCVNSNILLLSAEKGLSLNYSDSAAMSLISQIILSDDHKTKPHLVSPHYPNTAIILYHIARLIPTLNHSILNGIREKTVYDLYETLPMAKNEMEKVILLTSLYRLGEQVDFSIQLDELEKDMQVFHWFKANSFCNRNLFLKTLVGRSNFLQYQYKSEAYYLSLLLELKVLSHAVWNKSENRSILERK